MRPVLTHALIAELVPSRRTPGRPPTCVPDGALHAGMEAALAARPPGRLWVFAYSSLMWEQDAVPHDRAEVAVLRGFARRYCLRDERDRGVPEAPSLTLGVEPAPGEACGGVLFRLPETGEEEALWKVWRHEMPAGFYVAQWVDVVAGPGAGVDRRRALTFVADSGQPLYAGRVPDAEVTDMLARGAGPQGAAAAYLLDTTEALRRQGTPDPLLERLAEAAAARLAG
jgi:glutathione-specific gamma-glutamylcyclotransferase